MKAMYAAEACPDISRSKLAFSDIWKRHKSTKDANVQRNLSQSNHRIRTVCGAKEGAVAFRY